MIGPTWFGEYVIKPTYEMAPGKLAVALPLYYMATEHKELRGDDGDDDADQPGDDGPATVMAPQ